MKVLVHSALLLALAAFASGQNCSPLTCEPPKCRCWDDETIPGAIDAKDTPQIVLVTLEYAVNSANIDSYNFLFKDLKNPNGCPAVGTFFVQSENSDLQMIKGLEEQGHEIGITSVDGTLPNSLEQWKNSIAEVKQSLVDAGINENRILGVRAPNLNPGGLEEFTALAENGLLYDASCTNSRVDSNGSPLWPYSCDFPGPKCDNGKTPDEEFPGKWEVNVAELEFKGTKCASPSACTNVKTQQDSYDLFYESFIKHYNGNRSPFVIIINPDYAANDAKNAGAQEFLEYVRAAFEDTWIITVTQALEWVQNPVNNANATSEYPAWTCL